MTYKEFLEYLENDFDGYEIFMEKATEYQQNKNQKRPSKSRWNPGKGHDPAHDAGDTD